MVRAEKASVLVHMYVSKSCVFCLLPVCVAVMLCPHDLLCTLNSLLQHSSVHFVSRVSHYFDCDWSLCEWNAFLRTVFPCSTNLIIFISHLFSIEKSKALCLILHTADIGHPSKPWVVHKRWTDNLIEEFFKQVLRCVLLLTQAVE